MDVKLLNRTFQDNLKNSIESIAGCYKHLFDILSEKQQEETLQWVYESYTENKDNENREAYWFYDFHKSMRQTDLFNGCVRTFRSSTLNPEEVAELEGLALMINTEWTKVKNAERKTTPGMSVWDYFKTKYPEKHTRYRELKQRHNNEETESINGHLDMIMWNLVHVDNKEFLRLTMLRSFKQYDLEMEMLDELKQIEDAGTD